MICNRELSVYPLCTSHDIVLALSADDDPVSPAATEDAPMDEKIVKFRKAEADPSQDRAAFFAELEIRELTMTIPLAAPVEPKAVY